MPQLNLGAIRGAVACLPARLRTNAYVFLVECVSLASADGQLALRQNAWEDDDLLTRQNVRTLVAKMESAGIVELEKVTSVLTSKNKKVTSKLTSKIPILTIVNYHSYIAADEKSNQHFSENGQKTNQLSNQYGEPAEAQHYKDPKGSLEDPVPQEQLSSSSKEEQLEVQVQVPLPPPPITGQITDLTNTELGLLPNEDGFDEMAMMDSFRKIIVKTPLARTNQMSVQRVIQILHRSPDIRLNQTQIETILSRWVKYGWPINPLQLLKESKFHPGTDEWEVILHKSELEQTKTKTRSKAW